MREYDLKKLIDDSDLVNTKLNEFIKKRFLFKQKLDEDEIKGHLLKADHNLRFVADIIKKDYSDWVLTGCYYSSYHAALALIQTKGYTSKNHFATLLVILKEFYDDGLNKEDIELFSSLLDYEDVLFYIESKNKREHASYSTKTIFDKKEINNIRIKTVMFVNKIKELLDF